MHHRFGRSRVILGVAMLVAVAVAARAVQPHVRAPRTRIWCDGIDDAVNDPFWGALQNKKPDERLPLNVHLPSMRIGREVLPPQTRKTALRDEIAAVKSLLFRPRLFTAANGTVSPDFH